MKTFFTKNFKKAYTKRILPYKNLDKRFAERYQFFAKNPKNKVLKDHPLKGKMKGFRSFSITGDVRAIYYIYKGIAYFYIYKGIAYFVNIGTHNQLFH